MSSNHQPRKRKPRNSAVRKEQNRKASWAYREKRKQKLALLDEILRAESRTDVSMSSVSDETAYGSPTPALVLAFRATEMMDGAGYASHNSSAPSWTPAVPTSHISASPQPLSADSSNHSTEVCTDCCVNGYCQETRPSAHPAGYAHDLNIEMRLWNDHIYNLRPIPSTTIPPFDEKEQIVADSSFSDFYSLPTTEFSTLPVQTYDLSMVNALGCL
ncbi:hypothetical protein GGR50DRAFT_46379 [Xylaria sp. CBS 124048]|nr:hypothetical protein GGR50DRAFT_46379 [Xylaria sp. CBS 124048]